MPPAISRKQKFFMYLLHTPQAYAQYNALDKAGKARFVKTWYAQKGLTTKKNHPAADVEALSLGGPINKKFYNEIFGNIPARKTAEEIRAIRLANLQKARNARRGAAPWYYDLSKIHASGINKQGQNRKDFANKDYKNALRRTLDRFYANYQRRHPGFELVHGLCRSQL